MSRVSARIAASVAIATVFAVTGLSGASAAPATTTAPTGSLVIQEDNTFLQQSASAGIIAVALPSATVAYNSSTGLSATFPVTGGSASLVGLYGNVQLGGSLLLVNVWNGSTVVFNNLALSVDNFSVTGVPLGGTAPINLLDTVGVTTKGGVPQTLQSTDLQVDADGAAYLDTKLKTSFFVSGQHTGTAALSFTAGS